MPICNLIEYSVNYSKISGILRQYCRDEPALANNGDIRNFNEENLTCSFDCKGKITSQTSNNGKRNAKIMVPLKYLSNFWRALEVSSINCEINLDLSWSKNCVTVATNVAAQGTTFSIIDVKSYVAVATLWTQDNAKLLEQLKSGLKQIINWNKYQSTISTEKQNQYLDDLIDPSFQGVNRLFVLPFESKIQRISYKRYYLSTLKIKHYNVMIHG